jgi:ribonuclease HI
LEAVDGSARLEAEDEEPETDEGRLELLAVVRGLEALDQPSRVTVVTPSRYVTRGFRFGLEQWRENGWCWERFGEMTPIKNRDLWQRVDQAMRFHRVECRAWRFDLPEPHAPHVPSPAVASQPPSVSEDPSVPTEQVAPPMPYLARIAAAGVEAVWKALRRAWRNDELAPSMAAA